MKRERSKVIFVGQFPPPVNGLTYITSHLASDLAQAGYDLALINTGGSGRYRSILFHIVRILKVSRALFLISSNALSGKSRVCYFTAEGGLGLIYSVLLAGCSRLLRLRIYIHHHSFSYIVRWRPLMKLLLACCGSEAVHICLCSGMAQALASVYGQDIHSIVLSNAAFISPVVLESSFRGKELRIGLLSNLTADKGLYEFLKIVQTAKQRALPIRGILAGPVTRDADMAAVEGVKKELEGSLDYRGAVYDKEKAQFFLDIDVFVFLTTYPNEAQPTVAFEAMARGIPVISYDRGCIRSQVGEGGYILSQNAGVVTEVLNILQRYCEHPDSLETQRHAALAQFEDERSTGRERVACLFEMRPTEVKAVKP